MNHTKKLGCESYIFIALEINKIYCIEMYVYCIYRRYSLQVLISTSVRVILYIKMNVCMFVCTLYKSTFLNRSESNFAHFFPRFGRDRRIWMGSQYFTFSTFLTYFAVSGCRCVRSRWLPAPHCSTAALYPRAGVTSRTVGCAMKMRRSERNACVKMETWWDRMEVTNELNLQLHCIYTNDNVQPI
jgi:hypothetical protein